jgi:23S rRNA pseudouridine1911/1915/1917 synthase
VAPADETCGGLGGDVKVSADVRILAVPDGVGGERVDAAVARMFGLSRTKAADLVRAGDVLVDGVSPTKSERVLAGALLEVRIPPPPSAQLVVPAVVEGLAIVHDDEDIVVVDKPVGVAAHASVGWTGPTVLGHLAAAGFRIATSGVPERHGIVQRLDVGTSGLMVVAKSEHAYSVLKQAFRDRSVDKTYHALVQGHPDPLVGTIDAPIKRDHRHDHKFTVAPGGRHSVTHYDTLEAHRYASLLDVKLETGRTHQIRVHLSALRHPCVGDLTYGADPVLAARVGLERQWLHAVRLGFEHPESGRWVEYTSSYPDDLTHALDVIRNAA